MVFLSKHFHLKLNLVTFIDHYSSSVSTTDYISIATHINHSHESE